MIIQITLIALVSALLITSVLIYLQKKKKKRKTKPSLYKPRTIESVQSTLKIQPERPQVKKQVKVLNLKEKKEQVKQTQTTTHTSITKENIIEKIVEKPVEIDQIPTPAKKVFNTAERAANRPPVEKPEIKLVKKSALVSPISDEKIEQGFENEIKVNLEIIEIEPIKLPEIQAITILTKPKKEELIPDFSLEEKVNNISNFNEFVSSKFDLQFYTIKQWDDQKFATDDRKIDHHPNLEVEFNSKRTVSIALEVIWIEQFIKGGINWAVDFDLKDFKQFYSKKRIPYFIIIGVGGEVFKPQELFIVPLQKIETEFISKADLFHYQKNKIEGNFFYDYSSNVLR